MVSAGQKENKCLTMSNVAFESRYGLLATG